MKKNVPTQILSTKIKSSFWRSRGGSHFLKRSADDRVLTAIHSTRSEKSKRSRCLARRYLNILQKSLQRRKSSHIYTRCSSRRAADQKLMHLFINARLQIPHCALLVITPSVCSLFCVDTFPRVNISAEIRSKMRARSYKPKLCVRERNEMRAALEGGCEA
jgi:hypothetical protein